MALGFSFLTVLSVVALRHLYSEASPISEECQTESCRKTAHILEDFLDTSADPCKDFYQYACGGWIEKHPIPDDRVSLMTYEVLRDEVSDRIEKMLTDPNDETLSYSVYDAASLYKGCINEEAREAKGLDPLRRIISKIGGWPIAERKWNGAGWNGAGYTWHKHLAEITRDLSYTPIIGVGVDVDANKTSQHAIYITPSSFGLGRNQLVNSISDQNKKIVSAYKDYIVSAAKLLNPTARKTQLERDASDIIRFEESLARLTRTPEETRSARSWYHKKTVAEVQRTTENELFEWTDFLNDMFRDFPKITDETEVILTDQDYFKNALKLVKKTNPRVLANYIGWTVVRGLGPHTTENFRLARFNFEKVQTGIQKPMQLKHSCTGVVVMLMGFAVGRLYVDNYFAEAQKEDVEDLVEDIRSVYRLTIESNEWMDAYTRFKALEKLDAVVKMMGYPSWILNNHELDKHYETARGLNSDEFVSSLTKAVKSSVSVKFGKWNKPTNRTYEWRTYPPVVNAFYSPSANTITFPAGILNEPFYEYDRAAALNFGALGGVIGHELSHAFDDQGGEYDSEGNLVNWWKNETREKFNEKADCFREQYSSYVEPTTNMRLNGNNTVGENIADNGALRNAYLAFKVHSAQQGAQGLAANELPGSSITPEQLFFIGRATTYCGSERKESLALNIQYGRHSPNRYRVIVPLSNSEEFPKAFNCPLGSPMNPENKCILW